MDPLLPLTIAAVSIAALARFRSRLGACSILGASLASVLLMFVTHIILRDNHPYTPNAQILPDSAVAIFHEHALHGQKSAMKLSLLSTPSRDVCSRDIFVKL